MDPNPLYPQHIETVQGALGQALELSRQQGASFSGIVFHAGSELLYHADDIPVPFHSVPHFARWAPVPGPDHLLLARPDAPPRLVRLTPRGFWVEPPEEPDHPWAEVLEVQEVATLKQAFEQLGDVSGCAYVGNNPGLGEALELPAAALNPEPLVQALDWFRAYKTPYEAACLREAARIGGLGHAAVRSGVQAGRSERALHLAYLEACGLLEYETPYTNIIAWDEAGAVLHYQSKRRTPPQPGTSFLIDAGGVHHGYNSDITRSYLREGVHPTFRALHGRMHDLQDELVDGVRAGLAYLELHERSYRGVARILTDLELLSVSADEACEKGLVTPFYPHGVGHHLGLQVHDVGGKLQSPVGEPASPPERYPWLRTTRPLEEGQVVTIEPGLYFIPLLLEPFRTGEHSAAFAWELIDALVLHGGVRVEDDIWVTSEGAENLTRPFVPFPDAQGA